MATNFQEKVRSLISAEQRHKSYFVPQITIRSLRWNLENVFGSVGDLGASSKDAGRNDNAREGIEAEDTFRLMGCVTVKCTDGLVELEWLRNSLTDFIVDAATVVLMTLGGSSITAKGRQSHFSRSSGGYSSPTQTYP